MAGPAPGYDRDPAHRVEIVPSPKRIRVLLGGEAVADSLEALLLLETGHAPVYYLPRKDVRSELLRPSGRTTRCPFKGDARYWSVAAGGSEVHDAVWSYEDPFDQAAAIAGHMAFYWDRMDAWLEEDERIFVHPCDPGHRIDIRDSRRRVTVRIAGTTLADTTQARFLFETGLPPRYYIPPEDVRTELLEPSDTRSACPYKGSARHFSAHIGGERHDDIAWAYPMPLPEARRIAEYLCFYPARAEITVANERV